MTTVQRLDAILKSRGMSRRQAAIAAKIPPSTLQSAMERGKNISVDMLQQLAAALDIPVTELVGDDGRIIDEKMIDEEVERVFFYKLDDYLADMTTAEKDLLFRLYLAQAEEMSRYSKEHKKTPPEAQEGAPEGE